ncbi:MAG: patatin-like phospholipase family protein [Hahellaceae bacterium]|nr:patatin-like phospholipase family protein [Hahellaceae bacterium]
MNNKKSLELPLTGVVLTGGGARAAYQVGVLKAISEMFPDWHHPFPVIVGTSAGALNAVGLASGNELFRHNVARLERIWANLKISDIYKSDVLGMTWGLSQFLQGVLRGHSPEKAMSLLDNSPLRTLLKKEIQFENIKKALQSGTLHGLGINACGYSCGQNICFYQGQPEIQNWNQGQRLGVATDITLDHLMASSAIPTLFPPVRINREYFGDGVIRQMAHISPALHLGAQKILVVGVSATRTCAPARIRAQNTPTLAQVMEHVLNGAFLDTLDFDIDRLELVNTLLELIPPEKLKEKGLNLKPVDVVEISPSRPVEEIASRHTDKLPTLLKRMMGKNLDTGEGGASLASYILFDAGFAKELIALGYADAQAESSRLEAFFRPTEDELQKTGS